MKTKIILLMVMLSTSALQMAANCCNSSLVSESRTSKPYHFINITGEMNVKIIQEKIPGVLVEGSNFQLDNTVTVLRNDTLFVFEANKRKNDGKVSLSINVENMTMLEVSGKSIVYCEGMINSDLISIKALNGARIKLDLHALNVKSNVSGCGFIDLSGMVGSISKQTDGCGSIDSNSLFIVDDIITSSNS